jgi:hypothetical protein
MFDSFHGHCRHRISSRTLRDNLEPNKRWKNHEGKWERKTIPRILNRIDSVSRQDWSETKHHQQF